MNQPQENGNSRLIATVVITGVFLVLWQYFYEAPRTQNLITERKQEEQTQILEKPQNVIESQAESEEVIEPAVRHAIPFKNKRIEGEINLTGASIDKLFLVDYKEDIDGEEKLSLLFPETAKGGYVVCFNWAQRFESDKQNFPNSKTLWKANMKNLVPGKPLVLSYKSPNGIEFLIKFNLDNDYLFEVNQEIINHSGKQLHLLPYAKIKRKVNLDELKSDESHIGPVGVIDGKFKEITYKDILQKPWAHEKQEKGWIGLADKYWLSAVLPVEQSDYLVSSAVSTQGNYSIINLNLLYKDQAIAPNGKAVNTFRIFSGAKDVALLDKYSNKYSIPLFDRAIDLGFFHFMAKPVLLFLRFINKFVHNYGISIIIMTIVIRILLLPLAAKSYTSMNKIKSLAPKIAEVRQRYKTDKAGLNQELARLYSEQKINPFSSVLPLLAQVPIFFALYKVLYISIDMRHSPFFGWIKDLAAPDPTSIFNLFGLISFTPPGFLQVGILPIILGFTMWLQQKVGASATMDATQAKIMNYLPLIFVFIFSGFPAGMVIYWIVGNIFGIVQQLIINNKKVS